jgi:hypothetical protein
MELPVACTLSPDALATRREGLLADVLRLAQTREELGNGLRLSFQARDEVLARILAMIAAERRCCEFLRFRVTLEPAGGPLVLDLTGPHGTRQFLAALLES